MTSQGQSVQTRRSWALFAPPATCAESPVNDLVAVATTRAARRARAGRRRELGPGRGHCPPQPAGQVLAVALVLARRGVLFEGVQRMAHIGELLRAVGAGDRAERAW